MSDWRLFSVDSEGNGVYHQFDPETGKGVFKMEHNIAPLINANKEQMNASTKGFKGDGAHHMARISPALWAEWTQEFGSDPSNHENHGRLMAKLNDRDFSGTRVKAGRL